MTQPTIAVLGTGAIGTFYGVKLALAGYDVHFLARSEYAAIKENGLCINSPKAEVLKLNPVNVYRDVEQMPACDWVLVSTKTTANEELAPLIDRMTAFGGTVVLMQNGLGIEDELRPLLREDIHLFGGLCFICVHRTLPGVIEHEAYGGVNLGYRAGDVKEAALAEQGASMFTQAGIDCKAIELEKARWQKLVWNVPYNGLSVVLNSATRGMMGHASTRQLITDIMHEVVNAAAANGYALPDGIVEAMLKNTDAMPDYYPSMYHDYVAQRPLELDAIYRTPLRQAAEAGVSMPKTEMLLQALEFVARL